MEIETKGILMTNIKEDIFNTQKSEIFVSKLMDILNYGSLNIMISIGYRTRCKYAKRSGVYTD